MALHCQHQLGTGQLAAALAARGARAAMQQLYRDGVGCGFGHGDEQHREALHHDGPYHHLYRVPEPRDFPFAVAAGGGPGAGGPCPQGTRPPLLVHRKVVLIA